MDDQSRYLDAMRRFSGDPQMVAQVFASLVERGVTPTAEHWELLLQAHITAGDTKAADRTVEQMLAADVLVNDEQLFDVAVTCARRGDVARALHQFDTLHQRGARPSPRHAPAVFNVFVSTKRFPAARAVLRDITQRGETVPYDSYVTLLRDALHRRAVKDTEALVAMMLAGGHTPHTALASDLAVMMCQAADPTRAFTFVTDLLAQNVAFTDTVYATILRGLVARHDYASVERCADTLLQHGVPLTSFARNAVVHARLKNGNADGAWQALTDLWDNGMLASGENLQMVLTRSITERTENRAQATLGAMLATATPVTTEQIHAVVSVALERHDIGGAAATIRDVLYHHATLDRRVLRDITQALMKRHAVKDALVLLGDAKQAGVVSSRSYGAIIMHLLQRNQLRHARILLDFFTTSHIRLNTADASQVLRLMAREGTREDTLYACDVFTDQKVYADEPTYRELLWECARAGDMHATKRVYDTIAKAGIPHEESHNKALSWATGATPRRLDAPIDVSQVSTQPPLSPEAHVSAPPQDVNRAQRANPPAVPSDSALTPPPRQPADTEPDAEPSP